MKSLHIIFASTSGHTEYVIDTVIDFLKESHPEIEIERQRVEFAKPEDLARGDLLILASSTWNTNNTEGQLNPHMYHYLMDLAKGENLAGRQVAAIGLGDERYHYTCRAAEHLETFVQSHGGTLIEPTLRIVNEPYGQEGKVREWTQNLLKNFSAHV